MIYDTRSTPLGTRDGALEKYCDWPVLVVPLRIEQAPYRKYKQYHNTIHPDSLPTVRAKQSRSFPHFFLSFHFLHFSSSSSLLLLLLSCHFISSSFFCFFHRLSSSSIGLSYRLDTRFFFFFFYLFIYSFIPSSFILVHSCCLLFSLVLPYFDLLYFLYFFCLSKGFIFISK